MPLFQFMTFIVISTIKKFHYRLVTESTTTTAYPNTTTSTGKYKSDNKWTLKKIFLWHFKWQLQHLLRRVNILYEIVFHNFLFLYLSYHFEYVYNNTHDIELWVKHREMTDFLSFDLVVAPTSTSSSTSTSTSSTSSVSSTTTSKTTTSATTTSTTTTTTVYDSC